MASEEERFASADTLLNKEPQIQHVRPRIEAAETKLGTELSARPQPAQDHYEQALRENDTAILTRICPDKHGR
ncbi:hypothetical protein ACFV0Z_18415 [Streptomyces xiamenensis]|uniref:hypothetical protein n=1 Tax=Streptomyces xiamenensis TaxID=408015 RepID=UPI0036AE45FF